MKLMIREDVFETNSSSVHSITMVTKSDFCAFKEGKLVYDRANDTLIPVEGKNKDVDEDGTLTYENFFEQDYETFEEHFTTPSGETVVAFGYYGSEY